MPTWIVLFLGVAVTVCTILLIDAFVHFWRVSHGTEGDVVDRRLLQIGTAESDGTLVAEDEREEAGGDLLSYLAAKLQDLIDQAGSTLTIPKVLLMALGLSFVAGLALYLILPERLWYVSTGLGLAVGFGFTLVLLIGQRNARISKFEEQLPDTIDLIVRSLRVGHPISACLSIVAAELSPPIRDEFQIAHYKVSYGYTVSAAFREMAERVPLPDLKFLVAVVQLQEETGGNPVETLSKLAAVIRERFRMFRKIKAITAEGRLSAWLLSIFPFVTAFAVRVFKPDYYDKVMGLEKFPVIAVVIGIMLIANIAVMNAITKIKV